MGNLRCKDMSPRKLETESQLVPCNRHQAERPKTILDKTLAPDSPPQTGNTGKKACCGAIAWQLVSALRKQTHHRPDSITVIQLTGISQGLKDRPGFRVSQTRRGDQVR